MATFKLNPSPGDKFHFTLVADNHEKVLTSETYNDRSGALAGIESVRRNSQDDAHYEKKVSARGQHFFVLKAANGEPIGTSEEYSSEAAMLDGIAVIKKLAREANLQGEE